MTFRELWNGIRYGSLEGPSIEIDWEERKVIYNRMSARLARKLLRWTITK